jgi:hypothetical protein
MSNAYFWEESEHSPEPINIIQENSAYILFSKPNSKNEYLTAKANVYKLVPYYSDHVSKTKPTKIEEKVESFHPGQTVVRWGWEDGWHLMSYTVVSSGKDSIFLYNEKTKLIEKHSVSGTFTSEETACWEGVIKVVEDEMAARNYMDELFGKKA